MQMKEVETHQKFLPTSISKSYVKMMNKEEKYSSHFKSKSMTQRGSTITDLQPSFNMKSFIKVAQKQKVTLEALGLQKRLQKMVNEYSSGEKKALKANSQIKSFREKLVSQFEKSQRL